MATEIKKHSDCDVIDAIKHNFVADGDYTPDVIANEIKQAMITAAERICVLVAYNDENKIVGHLIGWIPDNRNYAWQAQAYHDAKDDPDIPKRAFEMLKQWARTKGVSQIRTETSRPAAAIARRWGFVEHSVIMRAAI